MGSSKKVSIVIVVIFAFSALISSPARVTYGKFFHSMKPSAFETADHLIEVTGGWRFFSVDDVSVDFSKLNDDGTRTLISVFVVADGLKNPCGSSAAIREIHGYRTSSCVMNSKFEVSELLEYGLILWSQEDGVIDDFLGGAAISSLD